MGETTRSWAEALHRAACTIYTGIIPECLWMELDDMHLKQIDPALATIPVTFYLEDPKGLTGSDQAELVVMAGHGQNLLEVAMLADINIEHACGGVCACSTCHVHIEAGATCLSESTEAEEDRVEEAPGLQRNSRLACQCVIQKAGQIRVRVPSWNRNAVKE